MNFAFRPVLRLVLAGLVLSMGLGLAPAESTGPDSFSSATLAVGARTPVIDVTDLYHYYQDPGDNLDLVIAFGLPQIDLRAVILDVTQAYRPRVGKHPGLPEDSMGPREGGFIPVLQLNRIFDRTVPFAPAPFKMMSSPEDTMRDAPRFEQAGIELLLETLRETTTPLEIVSFGSARPVAVAYNREPDLFQQKVRRIHLSAGSSEPGFMEWNVMLDPHAIVRLLRSDLPIAIYPCGTVKGAFDLGAGNTFWSLPDLHFFTGLAPTIQGYLAYAFERANRSDFLQAVERTEAASFSTATLERKHSVWETAIWMAVANLKLVKRSDGTSAIIPAGEVTSEDTVLPSDLVPCTVEVRDTGEFVLGRSESETNKWMYSRGDPQVNETALRGAFPGWYASFKPQ